jgi:lysophospholipase L1-like esterase
MFSRYGFAFDDALAQGWDATGPLPLPIPAPTGAVALVGLQARYRCDAGSGTSLADSSGNHYDGTFGATLGPAYYPTWTAAGVAFNGAQTIGIPAAALEGAQTIMVFSTPTLSNQAGGLTCVFGISGVSGDLVCGFAPGDGRPGTFATPSGDPAYGLGASATPVLSGTPGVTWRGDGTIYLNGVAVSHYQIPLHGGPTPYAGMSSTFLGSWFSAQFGFVGTIHYVLVWGRQLSTAEIKATHIAVANELAGRGLALTYGTALTHPLIATDGDSITRGYGASNGIGHGERTVGNLTGTFNFLNMAVGGQASGDILANAPSELDPVLQGFTGTSVLLVLIGTNGGFTNTDLTNLASYYTARKVAGWTYVIVVTGLPRGSEPPSFETNRQTFNAAVRAGVGTYCDAVADAGSDLDMGQAGQAPGGFYADGVHPNDLGHNRLAVYDKIAVCQVIPAIVSTIYDTFTGTNGTALTAHTPDVNTPGHTWASPVGALNIQGNKARNTTTLSTAISVIDSGRSDATAQVVVNETVGGNADAGLVLRYSDTSNYWKLYLDCAAGTVTLEEHSTANGVVTRGQANVTQSAGINYLVTAVLSGSTILAFVNGQHLIEYTNATQNQSATKHGITCFFQTGARDSTLDNFQIA